MITNAENPGVEAQYQKKDEVPAESASKASKENHPEEIAIKLG